MPGCKHWTMILQAEPPHPKGIHIPCGTEPTTQVTTGTNRTTVSFTVHPSPSNLDSDRSVKLFFLGDSVLYTHHGIASLQLPKTESEEIPGKNQ